MPSFPWIVWKPSTCGELRCCRNGGSRSPVLSAVRRPVDTALVEADAAVVLPREQIARIGRVEGVLLLRLPTERAVLVDAGVVRARRRRGAVPGAAADRRVRGLPDQVDVRGSVRVFEPAVRRVDPERLLDRGERAVRNERQRAVHRPAFDLNRDRLPQKLATRGIPGNDDRVVDAYSGALKRAEQGSNSGQPSQHQKSSLHVRPPSLGAPSFPELSRLATGRHRRGSWWSCC